MKSAKAGIWQMIFDTFYIDVDNGWIIIDSTIISVHQHPAGTLNTATDI